MAAHNIVQIVLHLQSGPKSCSDLVKLIGCKSSTIYYWLYELHAAKLVSDKTWRQKIIKDGKEIIRVTADRTYNSQKLWTWKGN